MIIKIKDINDFRFGFYGERANILEEIAKKHSLNYEILRTTDDFFNHFDIIFGSGIYEIVKEHYLTAPKYGTFFFHESPLPEGRGNAPIQWAVSNNRPNLTITAFKAEKGMDTGDYLYQYNVPIEKFDTYQTIDIKRKEGISLCFEEVIKEMQQGILVLRKQTGTPSINPKRLPDDSELDPNKNLIELWEEIRVCNNNKFPAFFKAYGKKIILRHEVLDEES